MRDSMAGVMGIPPAKIRVTTEEVGGAFGLKTGPYPEYVAMLVGAKKIGRPVYWMSGRNESFVSDNHARDAYSDVELALDDKGKFLALRIRHLGSMGAYIGAVGANIQTANMMRCLPGMYDIKLIDAQTKCVFTNTIADRALSRRRPPGGELLPGARGRRGRARHRHRSDQAAAAQPDFAQGDAVQDRGRHHLRQRRLRRPWSTRASRSPTTTASRRASAKPKKRGLLRGLGICFVLEHSGGSPIEGTQVSFPGGDQLLFTMNVQSTGQGHATIFPRLVAERLGIKAEQVGHAHGDSAHEIAGYASVGSRTAMTAGHAMVKTLEAMLAKGKKVAAAALEAGEGDIEYKNGAFNVVGTDRRLSLFDAAARAKEMKKKGEIAGGPRHQGGHRDAADLPERLPCRRGRDRSADRPLDARRLLRGGRLRQRARPHDRRGPGARLGRHGRRPGDDGADRVSTTAASSSPPRSWTTPCRAPHDFPMFKDGVHPVPATTNPLGVKGAGEAGTTAAIAAVMNAFADAIPGSGAKHPDAGDAGEGVEGVPGDGGLNAAYPRHNRATRGWPYTGPCAKRRDSGSSLRGNDALRASPAMTTQRSHSIRRGLVQIDADLAVLHHDLVGPQRREARRLHRLAGLHVERAEVQRAFDDVVFQDAVGEARRAVRAFVVGGVERAADVVDGDDVVPHLEALRRVLGTSEVGQIFTSDRPSLAPTAVACATSAASC